MEKVSLRFVASSVEGDDARLTRLVAALREAGLYASVRETNSGSTLEVTIPSGLRRRATRNAGAKRKQLPKGSPLEGMGETEALAWCRDHGAKDAATALGISVSAAYARMRGGRVLS